MLTVTHLVLTAELKKRSLCALNGFRYTRSSCCVLGQLHWPSRRAQPVGLALNSQSGLAIDFHQGSRAGLDGHLPYQATSFPFLPPIASRRTHPGPCLRRHASYDIFSCSSRLHLLLTRISTTAHQSRIIGPPVALLSCDVIPSRCIMHEASLCHMLSTGGLGIHLSNYSLFADILAGISLESDWLQVICMRTLQPVALNLDTQQPGPWPKVTEFEVPSLTHWIAVLDFPAIVMSFTKTGRKARRLGPEWVQESDGQAGRTSRGFQSAGLITCWLQRASALQLN